MRGDRVCWYATIALLTSIVIARANSSLNVSYLCPVVGCRPADCASLVRRGMDRTRTSALVRSPVSASWARLTVTARPTRT